MIANEWKYHPVLWNRLLNPSLIIKSVYYRKRLFSKTVPLTNYIDNQWSRGLSKSTSSIEIDFFRNHLVYFFKLCFKDPLLSYLKLLNKTATAMLYYYGISNWRRMYHKTMSYDRYISVDISNMVLLIICSFWQ